MSDKVIRSEPIIIVKRKGTLEDPYIDIVENISVMDNKIYLRELPFEYERVKVKEGNITYSEVTSLSQIKFDSQYFVDYRDGIVYFHNLSNDKALQLTYKGVGVSLYPSSRIYVNNRENIVETLQDFIGNALVVRGEVDSAIGKALDGAIYAQEQGDYAKAQGDYVKNQGDRVEDAVSIAEDLIEVADEVMGNELERQQGESLRVEGETTRQSNEVIRLSEEAIRKNNEEERKLNEQKRVSSENTRENQENLRQSNTQEAIQRTESAIQKALDESSNLEQLKDDVITATESANLASQSVGDAVTQANEGAMYAQQQGIYAKEQGDLANQISQNASDAESQRVQNEIDRIYAENTRQISEQERVLNEETREVEHANKLEDIDLFINNNRHIGDWSSNLSYSKNNAVRYNGSSFISLTNNNMGNQPNSTSDTEYWAMLAQRGVDGLGSVVSVNGKLPNENGDINLSTEDVGGISSSEKGVAGGVAKLDSDGNVLDGNDNIVGGTDGLGSVVSVNNKLPNEDGNIELSPEDIGGISSSEKGVAGGVARLDSDGNVIDGNNKIVEGKVRSINDKTGDVVITANDLDAYTKTETNAKIADLVGSAPETLDTLHELADALGNDPNFATTISNQIGQKINKDEAEDLIGQAEQNAKNYTDEQISEIDISNVEWSVINNKPNSSVEDIDISVGKSHEHVNRQVLDKINEDKHGNIVYNGESIGNKLVALFEEYVATKDNTYIIPISNSFSNVTDNLYAYYKGIRLEEGENYTISSDNQSIELLGWSIDSNDEIEIYIHKNEINVDNLASGSQLLDGSIDKVKLSPSLQAEINGGGNKVSKKINKREGTILLNGSNINNFYMPYSNEEVTISKEENITLHSPSGLKIDLNNGLDYEYMSVRNNDLRPFIIPETMSLFLYIEDVRNVIALEIYFSADYTYEQYVSKLYSEYDLSNGWNELILHKDHFDNYEGSNILGLPIVSFQIRAETYSENDNKGAEIIFDSLRVRNKVRPKVLFTFDDGWASQYTNAFPILLERGMVGNIGVVPTWIGENVDTEYDEPIMNFNQLKEMYDYGWDLFNHTYTHPNLENISPTGAINEVIMAKDWLNNNGFTRASDLLAYPYGGYRGVSNNPDFAKEIRYGRTLANGLSEGTFYNHAGGKTVNMLKGMSPQIFKNYIDEAIRTGGDLVFCNHIIANLSYDPWGMAYPIAQFIEVVDYLYEKRDEIDVVSISEWVEDR